MNKPLTPYVESFILPALRQLRSIQPGHFRSGLVADLTGYSQRRTYDFLRELELAGFVSRTPRGKRWVLTHKAVVQ